MWISLAAGAAVVLATTVLAGEGAPKRPRSADVARFVGVRDFAAWTREAGVGPGQIRLFSPPIDPGIAWDQLVVSWNVSDPAACRAEIRARCVYPDHTSADFIIAEWSGAPSERLFERLPVPPEADRTSVPGQRTPDGDVKIDTLEVGRPGASVLLEITLTGAAGASSPPALKLVGLSFLDSRAQAAPLPPDRAAWGREIDVPERAQGAYPHGGVICSPTCTSMMLAYWARKLHRPDLDHDVPEVCVGVYDRAFDGTGNWPFNTAYAGSLPGMRAYVARFPDIAELEEWIAAGLPVVCSVSYTALKGQDRPDPSGHLVVCVGFTHDGDVILNDPALNPARGLRVRSTYPRRQFLAGWADSHNTVYLIFPEHAKLPRDRLGHW